VSRSLLSFLLFLAVLTAGAVVVGWWVGPAIVSLAIDEDRRSAPYYLIHLFDEGSATGYFQSFSDLLREEEAQLLWLGGLRALHSGRRYDEAAEVAIIEFGRGSGVVQMMTSSTYRELTESVAPVLLGSPSAPGPIARDEILILWLLETVADTTVAELEPLSRSAGPYEGQLVWSVPVDVLEGDRTWNHALLIAFPDPGAVQAWLQDPRTATDRALVRRFYVEDAMLELKAN